MHDLKKLRRETKTVGIDVQDDLFDAESQPGTIQTTLSDKVEDIIDEKTKSIVGVITNAQIQDYYR